MENLPLIAFSILILGASSHAAVLSLTPARDRTIRNGGTSGANDTQLIIGNNTGTADLRALLDFNLTAIPLNPGETISVSSVTLTVKSFSTVGNGTALTTFNLNDYGFDFLESGATWNDPDGDASAATGDTTAGGTVGTLLSTLSGVATTSATGTAIVFNSTPDLVADVQALITSGGDLNYILTSTQADGNFIRIFSTEGGAGNPPTLTITYEVIPEPAAAALLGLGGLAFFIRRRR